jgi:hypothetical protein
LADLVDQIKDDLSQRARVNREAIAVIEVEAVDWGDSSLGCPEPGQAYLQVITPGYRLVLTAAGEEHHYHTRDTDHAIYCEDP